MKIVLFYHSLISDWNHGNAHFLRGVAGELIARGHRVEIYEPADAWSVQNLLSEAGEAAIEQFHQAYPNLRSHRYALADLDLDRALDGADLVLVHEWNDSELVRRVGEYRSRSRELRLFFHDTHHRAATAPDQMARYDLHNYDGVLAYGEVIRKIYTDRGWASRAWTWHEAADTRVFHPIPNQPREGDLVWIGNWGDEERTAELHEFVFEPVRALNLTARVYGVRYPAEALATLVRSGIEFGGWLANYRVPRVFARFSVTVHVPRQPYVQALPGIPTIRPFEALACGIPLICAPWDDREGLFTPGRDFLVARSGEEMKQHLWTLLADKDLAGELAEHGLKTILGRHTCAHRVDQLLAIYDEVKSPRATQAALFGPESGVPGPDSVGPGTPDPGPGTRTQT